MEPVYNRIGKSYNQTRKADPYLTSRLYSLLAPKSEKRYLDIGCGTGNYTTALHKKGVKLHGVDPSTEMLIKAKQNSPLLSWSKGTAEAIPFPDAHFDGAIATLTLHHWTDLEAGMKEIYRVVKEGRWVIFTSFPSQMQNCWVAAYFPQMVVDSMKVMPTKERTIAGLKEAGWKNIRIEPYAVQADLEDLFLYSGKYDPLRYLDAEFRSGISSFRLHVSEQELQQGLLQLEADIKSGKWHEVVQGFDDSEGDYAFVVVEK